MSTTNTKSTTASFDSAFEQVKDSSEQFLAAARKAGNLYVDSYEKAIERAIELQLKVAGISQQEWLKSLIEAQVDLEREFVQTYTSTARTFLKS
jgi:hypothetical protein